MNQAPNIYINASQSFNGKAFLPGLDASTDQPQKVPAESACLPGPSHPSPVALALPMKKHQGVPLGAGSGPCGQATIWGRRSRNDMGEGSKSRDLKLPFLLI